MQSRCVVLALRCVDSPPNAVNDGGAFMALQLPSLRGKQRQSLFLACCDVCLRTSAVNGDPGSSAVEHLWWWISACSIIDVYNIQLERAHRNIGAAAVLFEPLFYGRDFHPPRASHA